MRKIFIFVISIFLGLSACHKTSAANPCLDYADFDYLQIEWIDFFEQTQTDYYVYFYSEQCYYCESFKQDILSYINSSEKLFFLLPYKTGIPIGKDLEKTIGAKSLEQMWFGGTPSLIYVENKTVENNLLGVQNICFYLQLN